jgi:type VI secretion system protein ImpA
MMPELEIDALLQPLPGDSPCGASLIHDPEYDAIRTARRADDASVPAGIWQTTLKVADWVAVESGCRHVLLNRSKDLTVAAWLGEAWLNRYGVPALPHCFQLIVGLCERYWDDLHPLPRDGDVGFRAAPLAWLAGAYPDRAMAKRAACGAYGHRAARRACGEEAGSSSRDGCATGRRTGGFTCGSAA